MLTKFLSSENMALLVYSCLPPNNQSVNQSINAQSIASQCEWGVYLAGPACHAELSTLRPSEDLTNTSWNLCCASELGRRNVCFSRRSTCGLALTLTLKTFSTTATHVANVCAKFRWNLGTKWTLITSRRTGANARATHAHTDGRAADPKTHACRHGERLTCDVNCV